MDLVGFAIGVVSLTSIVSTCIEGFRIFKSMRGYEHDAETIMLKLETERALFIEWAYNVGLLKKHYVNVNMFSPRADKLIHDILVKIKQLLDEAEALARKYGLIEEDESWKSCFESNNNTTMTKEEWCHCDRHRTKHHHQHRHLHRSQSSSPSYSSSRPGGIAAKKAGPLFRKFMWTIHAKAEFESLIEQLHYFIERLDQMVKSVNQRQMLLKDLRGLGADFSKLDLIEDNSNEDKWSVQSSDGRSGAVQQQQQQHRYHHNHHYPHQHDSSCYGHGHWNDVTSTFPDCGRSTTSNNNSNRKRKRSSDRHDHDHGHDYDDPPPPYKSYTSLIHPRPNPRSSSKPAPTTITTTTIYISDNGACASKSRSSSSSSSRSRRSRSRPPRSWLSGSSDFY